MSRNNTNFKHLCAALDLRREDVQDIMSDDTSRSQIDAWRRSPDSVKDATGSLRGSGKVSRYRPMPDAAFDRFCAELGRWLSEQEQPD